MDSMIRIGVGYRFMNTVLRRMSSEELSENYLATIGDLCFEGNVNKAIEMLQLLSLDLDRFQKMEAFAVCLDVLNRQIGRDASLAEIIYKERKTTITPADEGFLISQISRSFLCLLEDMPFQRDYFMCLFSLFKISRDFGYCTDAIAMKFQLKIFCEIGRLSQEGRFREAIEFSLHVQRQCPDCMCEQSICNILSQALEWNKESGLNLFYQFFTNESYHPVMHNAVICSLVRLGYLEDALDLSQMHPQNCEETTYGCLINALCVRGYIGDIAKAEGCFSHLHFNFHRLEEGQRLDFRGLSAGLILLSIKECVEIHPFGRYIVLLDPSHQAFIQEHLEKVLPWWGVKERSPEPFELEFYNKQLF